MANGRGLPPALKRFGQHFLVDRRIINQIVELVQPVEGDIVLEVGPGRGALTGLLLERLERLIAVEVDRGLVELLRKKLPSPGLILVEGDILQADFARLASDAGAEQLHVVGNLPYNISAPLFFKLIDQQCRVRSALLMVQREVAQRLAAQPGSRRYSLLTVLLSQWFDIQLRLQVPARAFRPVPKVESAVIELTRLPTPRYPVQDQALFGRVVRSAFGQRRKMLRNSLQVLARETQVELAQVEKASSVELTRRPETLSLEEFGRLSDGFAQKHEV